MRPGAEPWDEIFHLLEHGWPRVPAAIEQARAVGVDWRVHSTPHVLRRDGRVVAHVGVMPLSLVVGGVRRDFAGVHAVVTHPDWRGRGLAGTLLDEVLTEHHASGGLLLFARRPDLYAHKGFVAVEERRFEIELAEPVRGEGGLEPVNLQDSAEVARVVALADDRAPVSTRLGVVGGGWLFVLDELLGTGGQGGRLWWAPGREAVLAGEFVDRTLHLYDLAAPRLPSLRSLVRACPGRVQAVHTHFSPDRLIAGAELDLARVRDRPLHDGDDLLMVHGGLDLPGPAAVPLLGHV